MNIKRILRKALKDLLPQGVDDWSTLDSCMNVSKLVEAIGTGITSLGEAGSAFTEAAMRVTGEWYKETDKVDTKGDRWS